MYTTPLLASKLSDAPPGAAGSRHRPGLGVDAFSKPRHSRRSAVQQSAVLCASRGRSQGTSRLSPLSGLVSTCGKSSQQWCFNARVLGRGVSVQRHIWSRCKVLALLRLGRIPRPTQRSSWRAVPAGAATRASPPMLLLAEARCVGAVPGAPQLCSSSRAVGLAVHSPAHGSFRPVPLSHWHEIDQLSRTHALLAPPLTQSDCPDAQRPLAPMPLLQRL